MDILHDIIQDKRVSIFFSTHITTDLEKIADYITFINNGKIIFSEAKDKVLEDFAIVKGKKELLDSSIREDFIAIKETSSGFEGLTRKVFLYIFLRGIWTSLLYY